MFNRTSIFNLTTGLNSVGVANSAYGGTHAPDIVGNIRVDQAWGLFQLSAAAHLVNASYNNLNTTAAPNALSEISGHPGDKWGGSVMAALQIKNIPTGEGDDIKMDATWSKGDVKNVISTSSPSPNFAIFGAAGGGAKCATCYDSVAFGSNADAVYLPGSGFANDLQLTTAFGFRGAFNHNWDPYWSSSLFGSYSGVRFNSNAKLAACTVFNVVATNRSADFSCNPDYNVSQLGVVTRWTPVKNLTFSAEAMWFHIDQKFTGSAVLSAAAAPKPVAQYSFADQDVVSLNVRVQRNF